LDAKVPFPLFFIKIKCVESYFRVFYFCCWKFDLTLIFVIDGRVCWRRPYTLLMLSPLITLVSFFPIQLNSFHWFNINA
jgi:hypothetical protein